MTLKESFNPKITIITVTKNSEKFIERNILSVINQSYKNYEHIIIDGNSSDKTMQIIKKYNDKITRVISEDDNSLYEAMNKGITNSTGEIIGILNSDDYFYEKALQIVKDNFKDNKNIDFLFGSVHKHTHRYGFYPWRIHFTFNFYPAHSVGFFIKRNAQLKVGLYNTKYKYSADYDLFYRMIVKFKMRGIATKKNDILGRFSLGGLSTRIKYIDYLNENTLIRLDNGQNKFVVKIIYFLRYIKRIKLILKEK
ncbi:glycosyltransferase [Candidatus Pelagibacter sp.]|jgi:glycosyltransferase involved in cell wall biosynthesis|nr:glycosyltransferase [Candidatus Pelagibacter sp.]|tara:strand:+ start:307 stop:1065 length:759 start_codon:yes stop_codon:yes gene_type:complete